jgi:hypothetical protein
MVPRRHLNRAAGAAGHLLPLERVGQFAFSAIMDRIGTADADLQAVRSSGPRRRRASSAFRAALPAVRPDRKAGFSWHVAARY